jgi:hypothetical protein
MLVVVVSTPSLLNAKAKYVYTKKSLFAKTVVEY